MDWQEQLIGLYLEICQLYEQELCLLTQRMSNHPPPQFSDNEVATVYLWGILSGFQERGDIHTYARRHLAEWFPDLPNYSTYVYRVNRLDNFLCALTHRFMRYLHFATVSGLTRDSKSIFGEGWLSLY